MDILQTRELFVGKSQKKAQLLLSYFIEAILLETGFPGINSRSQWRSAVCALHRREASELFLKRFKDRSSNPENLIGVFSTFSHAIRIQKAGLCEISF